jgi:hypothetical protein
VRREKRTQVDEAARLHPNDWSSIEVRVLDVSSSGFRAECEARILVGTAVTLEVAGVGPLRAHVTWRRGERFGAKFDLPADLTGCTWDPVCDQVVLSRLLVDRALARRAGSFGDELELRRKILDNLPVRPVRGAEPARRRTHP